MTIKENIKSIIRDNFTSPQRINKQSSSQLQSGRIEFIDLAKGFCIILVVAFHCGLGKECTLINALRMPLYFVLSGLFFKDYGSFLEHLEKKINKLILPLIFFSVIFLFFQVVISRDFSFYDLIRPLKEPELGNKPIYFLLCLFWINVIFCFIKRKTNSLITQLICVAVLSFLGYILYSEQIYLPLFLGSSLTAFPFFYLGYLLRRLPLLYKNKYDRYNLLLVVVLIMPAILFYVCEKPLYIDFRINNIFGPLILIIPVSFSLVVGFLLFCKMVKWLPIVSYIGRYSIIVLGIHFVAQSYFYLPIYWFTGRMLMGVELFLFTIIISWLLIPIFLKFTPSLTAQRDRFKFSSIFIKKS